MKNAKKFIAIILAAMMLLTLASCNAKDSEDNFGGAFNPGTSFAPNSNGGNYITGESAPSDYDSNFSSGAECMDSEMEKPSFTTSFSISTLPEKQCTMPPTPIVAACFSTCILSAWASLS